MLIYPKICLEFDEKISLLNFNNIDFNKIKNVILSVVSENLEISSNDLQQILINRGFTVQITKIMQNNYSSRLNVNAGNFDYEKIVKIFEELLKLINVKKI